MNNAIPTVSIILPTYNRRFTIARSVSSVLSQSYQDYELIIIDDHSDDDTKDVVLQFADTRIHYIYLAEHKGAGGARNVGIREARGKFVAFQDSDDVWMPDKLEKQMKIFSGYISNVAVVYSDMLVKHLDGREKYYSAPECGKYVLVDSGRNKYAMHGIGIQSAILRKDALDSIGYFDELLPAFEDMDLFIRLSKQYVFYHVKEPLVIYNRGGSQVSSNWPGVVLARKRLFYKYFSEIKNYRKFLVSEGLFLLSRVWRFS